MGWRRRIGQKIVVSCAAVFVLCNPMVTPADTALFTAKRGFMFPDAFEGSAQFFQVSALFQNPAELAGAKYVQGSLNTSSGYLSYNQLVGGVVLPIYVPVPEDTTLKGKLSRLAETPTQSAEEMSLIPYTFGFGAANFEASDLQYGSVGSGGRGQRGGLFSDALRQIVFAMAYSPLSVVDLGVSVKHFQRTLGAARAEAYVVDLGVVLHGTQRFKIGVYTTNLFQTDFQWNGSNEDETLSREVVMAVKYYEDDWDLAISTDFSQYRIRSGWDFSGSFTFISDLVFSDDLGLKRYGYGTRLYLGDVAVEYFHTESVIDSFDISQDALAVVFEL